ncbi:MAG TPA: phosphate ABC transporter permease PstA [Polyangia bacterium]
MRSMRAMPLPEKVVGRVLLVIASSSIAALASIGVFIVREGAPLVNEIGLARFLSSDWHPTAGHFGIASMVVGSAAVTAGALVFGLPLGLGCAIVLGEMSPPRARSILKPLIEILAGIPSVVYGFVGIVVVLPWIRRNLGGPGASGLAAAAILGVMILPTITAISLDALRAVPSSYREGSLAMGATRWQTIRRVVLPAARSGIVAAVILAIGRAVGETMAVVMVAGNAVLLPRSPLDPVRTLTANLALEMGYATEDHRAALFATAIVLFVIIVALNALAGLARGRRRRRRARGALGGWPRLRALTPARAQALAFAVLWSFMVATLAILVLILAFVLGRGLPHVTPTFLLASPLASGRAGGVMPIVAGTLEVTLLGVAVATPLGVGTAIYLVEYTRGGRLTRLIRFGAECLAGVPSIIFGLFGFVLFVLTLGLGWSILAGGLTLAFMTLPLLIRTSEEALRAVPAAYRDVSLSLGASKWQTVRKIVVPAALPGIATGLVLGLARAIGETAALIFTAGSSLPRHVPRSLFEGTRTLSVHFYQLAREGISIERAYAAAAVLVLAISVINLASTLVMERLGRGAA